MPRKPRFYLPGIPAHIIQRGNNRQAIFFAEDDYLAYLRWLKDGAKQHGCRLQNNKWGQTRIIEITE